LFSGFFWELLLDMWLLASTDVSERGKREVFGEECGEK